MKVAILHFISGEERPLPIEIWADIRKRIGKGESKQWQLITNENLDVNLSNVEFVYIADQDEDPFKPDPELSTRA